MVPYGWAYWVFELRVFISLKEFGCPVIIHLCPHPSLLSLQDSPSTPLRPSEVLWPAFTYSKFTSLCFLLRGSHRCVVKFTDRFPCNEHSTANPSLLDLISDATALLSNVHPVLCAFSESSFKILEHMGHSYGNLIFPSVNPNACISSGFVLVDWRVSPCYRSYFSVSLPAWWFFDWMPNAVNFVLLGTGWLWTFFEMQLSFFMFWNPTFDLLGGTSASGV